MKESASVLAAQCSGDLRRSICLRDGSLRQRRCSPGDKRSDFQRGAARTWGREGLSHDLYFPHCARRACEMNERLERDVSVQVWALMKDSIRLPRREASHLRYVPFSLFLQMRTLIVFALPRLYSSFHQRYANEPGDKRGLRSHFSPVYAGYAGARVISTRKVSCVCRAPRRATLRPGCLLEQKNKTTT